MHFFKGMPINLNKFEENNFRILEIKIIKIGEAGFSPIFATVFFIG